MNMKRSDTYWKRISVIEPQEGWRLIDFKELKAYRDLIFFLVWRDIKVLYAQTILGYFWAILVPLIQIVVFTVIFGKIARISTEGIPYVLFSSVAVIPWSYMSQSMNASSQSLVTGRNLLGKVYFPRLIFPITPVLAKLVDFGISMVLIFAVSLYYKNWPTWNLLFFPLFVLVMMSISAGIGLWLSSMAIRFRDVKHAMPFVLRMLMYTAPIVYSASSIPEAYRFLYSLNPFVGVIEGFRSCMLGTPYQWQFILPGIATAFILLISGAFYYNHMEKIVVDVM
jgi:lipopolysaccharide transport system permease protein